MILNFLDNDTYYNGCRSNDGQQSHNIITFYIIPDDQKNIKNIIIK